MFDGHRLTDADRERLESGGPLAPLEKVAVAHIVNLFYGWAVGREHGWRLRWSDEWQDGLHVEGEPTPSWEGKDYFPGARTRALILNFFSEETDDTEPAPTVYLDAESEAFLKAL